MVETFDLVECPDDDHAVFDVVSGKGTYIRAFARDLGVQLGCFGHVSELRRTFVEPFEDQDWDGRGWRRGATPPRR